MHMYSGPSLKEHPREDNTQEMTQIQYMYNNPCSKYNCTSIVQPSI